MPIENLKQDKYFTTSNFNLAVFLLCKGLKLVSIKKSNSQRKVFVFEDNPQRASLVEVFNFGEENHAQVMLDIRVVFSTSKDLKNKLYLQFE